MKISRFDFFKFFNILFYFLKLLILKILDYGSHTQKSSLSIAKYRKYLKNKTIYRIIIRSDKIKSIKAIINFSNLYSQNILSKKVLKYDKMFILNIVSKYTEKQLADTN